LQGSAHTTIRLTVTVTGSRRAGLRDRGRATSGLVAAVAAKLAVDPAQA
jgi:hypothetical protein